MTDAFHYAADPVDTGGHDLPGLKASFVVDHVAEGTVLVDVGCGGGKMLRTIGAHRSRVMLLGCDVEAPELVNGDFAFARIDPATGRLPYDDSSADVSLVFDVLEDVERPAVMLDEVRRILRPDGTLVAFIPVEGERMSWYRLFKGLLGQDLYVRTKGHVQAFTHAGLDELLADRFTVVEKRYAYHPLGQLMDATLCAALSIDVVGRSFWAHSPFHGRSTRPSSLVGRCFAALLRAANGLAWAESRLLGRVRFGSAGVLLTAHPRVDRKAGGPSTRLSPS